MKKEHGPTMNTRERRGEDGMEGCQTKNIERVRVHRRVWIWIVEWACNGCRAVQSEVEWC